MLALSPWPLGTRGRRSCRWSSGGSRSSGLPLSASPFAPAMSEHPPPPPTGKDVLARHGVCYQKYITYEEERAQGSTTDTDYPARELQSQTSRSTRNTKLGAVLTSLQKLRQIPPALRLRAFPASARPPPTNSAEPPPETWVAGPSPPLVLGPPCPSLPAVLPPAPLATGAVGTGEGGRTPEPR